MFSRRAVCAFAFAAVTAFGFSASAQDVAPAKVGTVNPAKVFNEMQETKDLKQAMDGQRQQIENEAKQRNDQVQEARKRRALFEDGSPEFQKANAELIQLAVQNQAWQELVKADLARQQKSQMVRLFTKIEQATGEIAKERKLNVVVVEQRVDMPKGDVLEQMNPDQVRALINQRNVLYTDGSLDITDAVLKRVDENYKNKK